MNIYRCRYELRVMRDEKWKDCSKVGGVYLFKFILLIYPFPFYLFFLLAFIQIPSIILSTKTSILITYTNHLYPAHIYKSSMLYLVSAKSTSRDTIHTSKNFTTCWVRCRRTLLSWAKPNCQIVYQDLPKNINCLCHILTYIKEHTRGMYFSLSFVY